MSTDLTARIGELAEAIEEGLANDEGAARAACEPGVQQNGKWIHYGHPPGMRDGRQDRDVQLVGAGPDESSWTVCDVGQWERAPMVAAHIALHDPCRVLRDVKATRALVAAILAEPHDWCAGDKYYSCSQAADYSDGKTPGSGCGDPDRAGQPCDCGRDARVVRLLGIIAGDEEDEPEDSCE